MRVDWTNAPPDRVQHAGKAGWGRNAAGRLAGRRWSAAIVQETGRPEPKNSAWLIAARTVDSWNGLVIR